VVTRPYYGSLTKAAQGCYRCVPWVFPVCDLCALYNLCQYLPFVLFDACSFSRRIMFDPLLSAAQRVVTRQYYRYLTKVLQRCYRVVTGVSRWFHRCVTGVSQVCCRSVIIVPHQEQAHKHTTTVMSQLSSRGVKGVHLYEIRVVSTFT
jgi:hypothetical protein